MLWTTEEDFEGDDVIKVERMEKQSLIGTD